MCGLRILITNLMQNNMPIASIPICYTNNKSIANKS